LLEVSVVALQFNLLEGFGHLEPVVASQAESVYFLQDILSLTLSFKDEALAGIELRFGILLLVEEVFFLRVQVQEF